VIKDYKDLNVWQKGIELTKEIYSLTKNFPRNEQFGLTNQMRRSAVSIPSNIAEGWMRQHTNEYIQFIYYALGSCGELNTQTLIVKELGYIDNKVELVTGVC
jgi:four helix bundle protein